MSIVALEFERLAGIINRLSKNERVQQVQAVTAPVFKADLQRIVVRKGVRPGDRNRTKRPEWPARKQRISGQSFIGSQRTRLVVVGDGDQVCRLVADIAYIDNR